MVILKKIEIKCTGTTFLELDQIIDFQGKLKHRSKKSLEDLKHKIVRLGFISSFIIWDKNGIYYTLDGHARIEALLSLMDDGYEIPPLPVIFVQAENEKDAREKLLSISSQFGEFELDELQSWLDDFEAEEAESFRFVDEEIVFDIEDDLEETEGDDDLTEDIENEVTKLGDLWELGEHRVLCGDSTSQVDVDKLMIGKKADMVFTDPPYNIDYQGVSDKRKKIKNDKMSDKDFIIFLTNSLMGCETMYVCCSWQYVNLFKIAMENLSRKPKAMIVWNKVNPAQHLDKYFNQHELILYYGDFGGHKTLRGDVWELKRERNTVHPTMKPIELIEMALNDQPEKKIVQDSFLGSGSTLIASEKTNRICYGMELDEHYCDVIVKRYIDWCKKNNHEITVKLNGEDFDYSDFLTLFPNQ